jgi:hypothetical protein
VQPSRLRLRVRKIGLELSDSLFSTGSRINTEFSLGAPGENGFELSAKANKWLRYMEKQRKKPILVNFLENV